MTIARAHLVDPEVTRWYHGVTRCVEGDKEEIKDMQRALDIAPPTR